MLPKSQESDADILAGDTLMGFDDLGSVPELELPRLDPLDSRNLSSVENTLKKRRASLDSLFSGMNQSTDILLSDPSFKHLDLNTLLGSFSPPDSKLDLSGLGVGARRMSSGLSTALGLGAKRLSSGFGARRTSKLLRKQEANTMPKPPPEGRRLTRRQSSTLRFNSVVKKLHETNTQDWEKQNCHYCGRCRPVKERHTCKNQYCSLQGQRVKYMCKLCYEHQKEYFKRRGVDVKNILGDVDSKEWYCPACIVWEDEYLPHPGICCCSFRRNRISCPLHKDCDSTNGKRSKAAKQNYHCKPYKQKTKGDFKELKLDLSKIRIGSKPYLRIYGSKKLPVPTRKDKRKREKLIRKGPLSHDWLGDMAARVGALPNFVQTSPVLSPKTDKGKVFKNIPTDKYFQRKNNLKRHKTC